MVIMVMVELMIAQWQLLRPYNWPALFQVFFNELSY